MAEPSEKQTALQSIVLTQPASISNGPSQLELVTTGFVVGSDEMTFRCEGLGEVKFELVSLSKHDDPSPARANRWHFTGKGRVGKVNEALVTQYLPASYADLTPEERGVTKLPIEGIFFTQTRAGRVTFGGTHTHTQGPKPRDAIVLPEALTDAFDLQNGPRDMEFFFPGFACGATPLSFQCDRLGLIELQLISLSKHLHGGATAPKWHFTAICRPGTMPNRVNDTKTGKDRVLDEFSDLSEEMRARLSLGVEGTYFPASRKGHAQITSAVILAPHQKQG